MIIPVRCWSCGKVIAHAYADYRKAVESGEDSHKAMDDAGLERYCAGECSSHMSSLSMRLPPSVYQERTNPSIGL